MYNINFQCIFAGKSKEFIQHFEQFFDKKCSTTIHPLPKYFLKKICGCFKLYDSRAQDIFKLLCCTFCDFYSNNFDIVYKFFIIVTDSIGFDLSKRFDLCDFKLRDVDASFQQSLHILSDVLEILSRNKPQTDFKVNEISFTDFLKNMVLTIIHLSETTNKNIINIINTVSIIEPKLIETLIVDIVQHTMLTDNASFFNEYEKLMLNIFEIFSKLHRVQNFISRILSTLKDVLYERAAVAESPYKFLGVIEGSEFIFETDVRKILPESVLMCYTGCITSLASWQVVNMFKTFLFYLGDTTSKSVQNIARGLLLINLQLF